MSKPNMHEQAAAVLMALSVAGKTIKDQQRIIDGLRFANDRLFHSLITCFEEKRGPTSEEAASHQRDMEEIMGVKPEGDTHD